MQCDVTRCVFCISHNVEHLNKERCRTLLLLISETELNPCTTIYRQGYGATRPKMRSF